MVVKKKQYLKFSGPMVTKVNCFLFISVAWSSSARVVRWMVNCYERA